MPVHPGCSVDSAARAEPYFGIASEVHVDVITGVAIMEQVNDPRGIKRKTAMRPASHKENNVTLRYQILDSGRERLDQGVPEGVVRAKGTVPYLEAGNRAVEEPPPS